jgi:hypothetical protein
MAPGLPGLDELRLALPLGPEQEVSQPIPSTDVATGLTTPVMQLGRMMDGVRREDLARSGTANTSEQVARLPGVWMARSIPGAGSPVMRGMGGSRVLITVDGVRLNTSAWGDAYHPHLSTVDSFALERAVVVPGASGVVHGMDAMGGVLELQSRLPQHGAPFTVHTDGAAFFESANQGRGVRLYSEGGLGPLSASVAGDVRDTQDTRAGRGVGTQPATNGQEINVQARTAATLWGQQLWAGYDAARKSHLQYTQRCRPPSGGRAADCSLYDELYRDLVYLGFKLRPPVILDDVEGRLSYQHQWQTLSRVNSNAAVIDRAQDGVHVVAGWARGRSPLYAVGPFSARLVAGLDASHDVVESRFYRSQMRGELGEVPGLGTLDKTRTRLADGGMYTSTGLHVLLEGFLWRTVFARVGARTDAHRATAPSSPRDKGALDLVFLVPSAMAQVGTLLGNRGSVAMSLLHGYHAPNLFDLTGRGMTDQGWEFSDATRARVEQAYTVDGSTRLALGPFTGALSVYATRWTHAPTRVHARYDGAARVDDLPVWERRPGDDLWLLGGETWADAHLINHLHVGGSFTYVLGQRVHSPDVLPGSPPPHGVLRVTYAPPLGFYGVATCRFALPARRQSASDRDLASLYDPNGANQSFIFHLGGGYQLTSRTAVDLWVENLTDDAYRLHGSPVYSSGVNARVQLRLGF